MGKSVKLRHKRMARSAMRAVWHYRIFNNVGVPTEWMGPFAKWHRDYRSIQP